MTPSAASGGLYQQHCAAMRWPVFSAMMRELVPHAGS
jgi:hypothetical protein